jgi:hypothetical protein
MTTIEVPFPEIEKEEPKRECRHCNNLFPEKKIHLHHIHPKFMDNPRGDGLKTGLCEKDHNIIHLLIEDVIWGYVPKELKERCLKAVISLTKNFVHER